MAITRTQIAKQLLANGGRIGFANGAQFEAARRGESISPGTKGRPGPGPDKGPQTRDDNPLFTPPKEEQYEGTTQMGDVGVVPVPGKKTQKKLKKTLRDKNPSVFDLLIPSRRNLFNRSLSLIPRSKESITKQRNAYAQYLRDMGLEPSKELLDTNDLYSFFETQAFDKSSPDYEPNPGDIGTFNPEIGRVGTKGDAILNYGDFLLKEFNNPGVAYSGDIAAYRRDMGIDDRGPSAESSKVVTDPTDPTDPADPNATTDVFAGIAPRFAGSIFDFDKLRRQLEEQSAADGGRIGADEGGIMQMASAPDPMDTRNDMMQNLAIDNFGKPLKDLTEDEIIQIEEMMMEMDQYGSKPTSRSNKMMADLDIDSMIDEAKEQLSESRFGKSYDELNPLEQELILEIIRGVGKDVFGKKQMPESDRVMAQEGGIMDLETGRQMYFLGKLVKKATRAVKKIAKSPLGKVAIGAAALKFGPSFFGTGSFNPLKAITTTFGPKGPMKQTGLSGLGRILNKLGLADTVGGLTLGGKFGLGALTLPFLSDKQDEEDLDMGPELTMEELRAIRNSPYRYMAPAFTGSKYEFADGGRIGYQEGSKEPVAKKTMPLLDMDGKEMDLRDNGGFVPIGRMEKADDVPARLSKNEFVFTADAVRNAGEGDVDKGAEVMYNMMKNLESGGQVSEESQGLEGARDMFQTSKRLEEVL